MDIQRIKKISGKTRFSTGTENSEGCFWGIREPQKGLYGYLLVTQGHENSEIEHKHLQHVI